MGILVAHDCGYPLSRYTCRATRVAADFLDFIASCCSCRCSSGVAPHPLKIMVSHLPPPPHSREVSGRKFGSEKVLRYTGVSQVQLRVSRYTVQLRWAFRSHRGLHRMIIGCMLEDWHSFKMGSLQGDASMRALRSDNNKIWAMIWGGQDAWGEENVPDLVVCIARPALLATWHRGTGIASQTATRVRIAGTSHRSILTKHANFPHRRPRLLNFCRSFCGAFPRNSEQPKGFSHRQRKTFSHR